MPTIRHSGPPSPTAAVETARGLSPPRATPPPEPQMIDLKEGAIRALSAVVEGWRQEFSGDSPRGERLEATLSRLIVKVEAGVQEMRHSQANFESRLTRELSQLRGRFAELESMWSNTEDYLKNAQVALWDRSEEIRAQLSSLSEQGRQFAATSHFELQSTIDRLGQHMTAVHAALTEGSRESAAQLYGLGEALNEWKAGLDEEVKRSQHRVVRVLEVIDSRLTQTQQQFQQRIERSDELFTQATNGYQAASYEELTEAVRQCLELIQESAVKSEAGALRSLEAIEAVESRTMQTFSELRSSVSEERIGGEMALEKRIELGIAEPLKHAIVRLSDQLSDVNAKLDTIRNESFQSNAISHIWNNETRT